MVKNSHEIYFFFFLANNDNLMMDFFLGAYPHDGFNQGKEVAKRQSQLKEIM